MDKYKKVRIEKEAFMVSARAMVKCGKVHHLRTRVYVTMDEGFLWNCPSVKETKKELPLMMVTFFLGPRSEASFPLLPLQW